LGTVLRRILLYPLALLYGLALRLRHALYDKGVLKSASPALPCIVIGNVALGGTGKTPHVELVLRTLLDNGPLATLSRGYGRAGQHFHEVHREDAASIAGDEPLMLKRKFSGVRVFVGADRVTGVERIRGFAPEVKAVVLDDALQHRKLRGGLNLVLTTWQKPWSKDALLPAGTLRDLPLRARSADAVIVTKCPALPTTERQAQWRRELGLRNDQPLFFSGLRYEAPRSLHDASHAIATGPDASAFLLTGIANPELFAAHVRSLFRTVEHLAFPDHHVFTAADQMRIAKRFVSFAGLRKTLITTEKDAARLGSALISGPLEDLPIAVIGVKAEILNEPNAFAALLRSHVATHPTHR
jgi:tetraacyldisaccharide 4'-kinase